MGGPTDGTGYRATMLARRRSLIRPLTITIAALSLFAAACGGGDGGATAVRDADGHFFFEVPAEWTVYHPSDLTGVQSTPFVVQLTDFSLPVLSRVVFQASSSPDVANLSLPLSEMHVPVGSAVVRSISSSQRDQISRFLLAELVVPYHSESRAQEYLKQDIEVAKDYDGVQLIVAYTDTETESDAAFSLISITDPSVSRMYTIAVGCSFDCFGEHQEVIQGIVDSWLVNTK